MAKEKKKPVTIDYSSQTEADKEKALSNAISLIEKDFGKGAIMKLGQNVVKDVPSIPTGSLSLDIALGIGGVPKGRIIEIYGPESSGKTTLALHIVAQVQKSGGIASYVDAEHALDPAYAKNLGVDIDELYISQPDDGEQALEIAEAMVRSGAIDIIVIDSVAALVPRAEIEGDMGASHMGLQARLMSQALRKLTGVVHKTNCTIIFINQLREKIGGMSYGESTTTTGGRALKFYASVRIDIRRAETIKVSDVPVGSRTKVKVAKNKMAPPFKTCEFDIMYGKGISSTGDILDLAIDLKIANKSGAWFSYGDLRIGQGRENAKKYLEDNPEILLEIENKVRVEYGLKEIGPAAEKKAAEEAAKEAKPKSKSKSKKAKAEEEETVVLEEFEEAEEVEELEEVEVLEEEIELDIDMEELEEIDFEEVEFED
ncbi:recombinase RecA [Tyzzerella sp. OttesenSCG-928-J15]|nr:recombinase RecA [Tyzzerella sp. OttesenSCG-928-J15]